MTGGANLNREKTFTQEHGTQIRLENEPGRRAFHAETSEGRKGLA